MSDNLFRDTPEVWFTMGPRSERLEDVVQLARAGATASRLTFSFGTPQIQLARAKLLREAGRMTGTPGKAIADLAGEKVRLGSFGDLTVAELRKGDQWTLVPLEMGFDSRRRWLPVNSKALLEGLRPDDILVLGDGSARLAVVGGRSPEVACRVLQDGVANPNRGVVVQSSSFSPAALTQKDIADLEFIASNPEAFDAVAISFVSGPQDVRLARQILESKGASLPVIAKIETPSGVSARKEILQEADAIMIARGDLALFSEWDQLGLHCDAIVESAQQVGKPWILATQLVEGLERFAFPTRAEICDITHWCKQGAHALMLSYETAFGPRPAYAVECVHRIVQAWRTARGPA